MAHSIKKIKATAEKLHLLRVKINTLKETADSLKKERDETQAELLKYLTEEDLASMKVASGDTFAVSKRRENSIT